jgi:hypothetical protein
VELILRLVQAYVRGGAAKLELKTSARDLQARGDRPPAALEEMLPDAQSFSWEGEGSSALLRVHRTSLDFTGLTAEKKLLQDRCKQVPLVLTCNGQAIGPEIDYQHALDSFTLRRFYRTRSELALLPIWGKPHPLLKVRQRLLPQGWKEDAVWPRSPDTAFPVVAAAHGRDALKCTALIILHPETTRPNTIQCYNWGVRMQPMSVDLGFPGAWALIAADELAYGDDLCVVDDERVERYVTWVRAEVQNMVREATAFRHQPYPKLIEPGYKLIPLGATGIYAFAIKAGWPLLLGLAAGRGMESLRAWQRSRKFWALVEQTVKAETFERP